MLNTRVGSEARTRSSVNSFFARWTSRSPTVTLRRAGSMRISPTRTGPVVAAVAAAQDGGDPRPQFVVARRASGRSRRRPRSRPRTRSVAPPRPVRTMIGRRGSKRASTPSDSRIVAQDVEAGGVGQGQVEQQQVGVVVATEAQRVGGARRGQDLEAVRRQVVAEQVEGGIVVLADDDRGDLFSFGQHAVSKGRDRYDSPPPVHGRRGKVGNLEHATAPRWATKRRGGTARRTSRISCRRSEEVDVEREASCRRCGPRRTAGSAAPARPRRGRAAPGRGGARGSRPRPEPRGRRRAPRQPSRTGAPARSRDAPMHGSASGGGARGRRKTSPAQGPSRDSLPPSPD